MKKVFANTKVYIKNKVYERDEFIGYYVGNYDFLNPTLLVSSDEGWTSESNGAVFERIYDYELTNNNRKISRNSKYWVFYKNDVYIKENTNMDIE